MCARISAGRNRRRTARSTRCSPFATGWASCCPTTASRCSRTRASIGRETKNDPAFAGELAEGCDLYVNDAFGSAHRAHASTEGVAHLLPAYAGLLLEEELKHLGTLLGDVERPFVLISGGAKVDDKLGVLQNLGGRADTVLIGGKMAEQVRVENPLDFDVELPSDVVGAAEFAEDCRVGRLSQSRTCPTAGSASISVPRHANGSAARSRARARSSGTGRWASSSGPRSPSGTKAVAQAVAANEQAFSVVGGADSVRALNELGLADRISWVSTGGGASLELLEGKELPGVAAIPPRRGGRRDRRRQLEDVSRPGPRRSRRAARRRHGSRRDRLPAATSRSPVVSRPGSRRTRRTCIGRPEGAYTGEISPPMLLDLGVGGSLVGHSERRQYFGETDADVARRALAALAGGARRDRLRRRDAGGARLRGHGDGAPHPGRRDPRRMRPARALVLAYEPVWAIGTGRTATPEMAQEAHAFIKSLLDLPVLYGGSVKPDNADELMSQPDVDGALVGGASLDIESFASICEAAARAARPVQSDSTEV